MYLTGARWKHAETVKHMKAIFWTMIVILAVPFVVAAPTQELLLTLANGVSMTIVNRNANREN